MTALFFAADRILHELYNDGITVETVKYAKHVFRLYELNDVPLNRLASALGSVLSEVDDYDGLSQASAVELRNALAHARSGGV